MLRQDSMGLGATYMDTDGDGGDGQDFLLSEWENRALFIAAAGGVNTVTDQRNANANAKAKHSGLFTNPKFVQEDAVSTGLFRLS